MGRNKKIQKKQNNILIGIGILGLIIFIIFIGVFFIKNKQPEEVVSQPEVNVEEVTEEVPMEEVQEEIPEEEPIVYEAPEYEFKTDETPIYSVDLWPEIIKYLNYNQFDGIVFGGDIMDYCSRANMDAFKKEFEKLNKNVLTMYVRADHDYHYGYGGDVLTEPVA